MPFFKNPNAFYFFFSDNDNDAGAVQLGGLVHEAHNITWDHI